MTTTLAASGLSGSATGGGKVKRLKLLIYGPFGTWKTVNAHGLPNTRTLDFDDGMQSVEWAILAGKLDRKLEDIVYETILPPSSLDESQNKVFDLACDKIDEWMAEENIPTEKWEEYAMEKHGLVYPQFWDTLIIDSGTSLTSGVIVKALQETDRLDISKSWSRRKTRGLTPVMIQDRGALNTLFGKFLTVCFGTAKNIVLICHEYENTDKKGNLVGIEPLLSGQLRKSVPKDFDEVWYARVKGTKAKSEGVFQTQTDPMRRCRSRLGCLDPDEPADFAAIKKKIAEFYKIDPDKMWIAPHGDEAVHEFLKKEVETSARI